MEPLKGFAITDLIEFIKEQAPTDIVALPPRGILNSAKLNFRYSKSQEESGWLFKPLTQLFFDNERHIKTRILGRIDIPIHATMPILNRNQGFVFENGENIHLSARIPKAILDKYEHDPESLRAAGLALCSRSNRGLGNTGCRRCISHHEQC